MVLVEEGGRKEEEMVLVEEEGRVENCSEIDAEPLAESPPARHRKYILHIVITFFVFLIAVYFFLKPAVRKGDIAPDFSLPDLSGRMVSLSSLKGKVVFLNFWATWCPPCIEELPAIQSLSNKMAGTEFVIMTVNIDNAGVDSIKNFVKEKGFNFLVLLDPKSTVAADKYGITGVPESFIISRNGVVLERYIGPRDWSDTEFVDFFNKITIKKD